MFCFVLFWFFQFQIKLIELTNIFRLEEESADHRDRLHICWNRAFVFTSGCFVRNHNHTKDCLSSCLPSSSDHNDDYCK